MTRTLDVSGTAWIPVSQYARRHPRGVAQVRVASAIWLLVLAGIFCSRGYYWGAALTAPAVLHLWLAWRLRPLIRVQH
jgi:hypothetical protein